MKTILTALREKEQVTDETARTIARALGGDTIASAIAPEASEESTVKPEVPSDGNTSS
jgi:hypothetical protein